MSMALVFVGTVVNYFVPISPNNENAARMVVNLLDEMNEEIEYLSHKADFEYEANMTDFNSRKLAKYMSKYQEKTWRDWNRLKRFNWREFKDEDLKRQFLMISKEFEEYPIYDELTETISDEEESPHENDEGSDDSMSIIHATAKLCDYHDQGKCDLSLDPELSRIMTTSRDPKELLYYWTAWRDATGKKMRKNFRHHVQNQNTNARMKNFSSNVEQILDEFESDTIEQVFEDLLHSVEPFYKELHAYVRGKLNEYYGDEVVPKDAPIPSHILGTLTGFGWLNILDIVIPYPQKQSFDITEELIKQGYDQLKMYQSADEFFVSLNMSAVPQSFWQNSILKKPDDGRNLSCHGSAWDLSNGKDFRIMMCTEVTMDGFLAAYHEMGHIQYYIQYKDQPKIFRDGANSGFQEAIGDVIALSALSPKHLKRLGFLPQDLIIDEEILINYLLLIALREVAHFPLTYALEKWRWDVYRGKSTHKNYNCHYWNLSVKYGGIQPPVDRSEKDLDPGAIHHVAVDDPQISYFVSLVLEFQFHKALCIAAGEYDPKKPDANPIYNCDIYKSIAAGELLSKTLRLGASKPWPDALEMLTGARKMSGDNILEYFKPLQDWLKKENQLRGYKIGWGEPTVNACTKTNLKKYIKP